MAAAYLEFLDNTMRRLSTALQEKTKVFEELLQDAGLSESVVNLSDIVFLDEEIAVGV